jgi:hypothetical protein
MGERKGVGETAGGHENEYSSLQMKKRNRELAVKEKGLGEGVQRKKDAEHRRGKQASVHDCQASLWAWSLVTPG